MSCQGLYWLTKGLHLNLLNLLYFFFLCKCGSNRTLRSHSTPLPVMPKNSLVVYFLIIYCLSCWCKYSEFSIINSHFLEHLRSTVSEVIYGHLLDLDYFQYIISQEVFIWHLYPLFLRCQMTFWTLLTLQKESSCWKGDVWQHSRRNWRSSCPWNSVLYYFCCDGNCKIQQLNLTFWLVWNIIQGSAYWRPVHNTNMVKLKCNCKM